MALTGLQILKLLPRTNCKECGSNTCLAFALKLAAKTADLSQCPYASDEAKKVLGAAAEPPVKSLALGPEKSVKLGAETVLYRHEKTFVNQTALAININDTDSPVMIDKTLQQINEYLLERVGEQLRVDMVAVTQKGNDAPAFISWVKKAHEMTGRPLIIRSNDARSLTLAGAAIKGSNSILSAASPQNIDDVMKAAIDNGHALAVTAPDLDGLTALTVKLKAGGFNNIVLQFQTAGLTEQFQTNTIARRSAIKGNFKALGYPVIRFIDSGNSVKDAVQAVTEINKYGGVCVLPSFDSAQLAALMTLRQNIFTDPQKPIQVEPRLYPVGEPKADSPVFVTTNFSLTYFIVSGEIENAGTSAWLLVPECEGMSVLTAWAAGKFNGATIGKFAKEITLDDQVKTREMVIPGYVAQISGELEEALPGWKVLVGPQEAADIESFVQARLHS